MEQKKNLDENSLYNNIYNSYNGTYELLNTIIYKDLDCFCCSCDGKKIIMNNRNKFTFFYRGKCLYAYSFILCLLFPVFGLVGTILKSDYWGMLVILLIALIIVLVLGCYLKYYSCLILDQNTITIIKRRLLFKTSSTYERCDLEKFELEFKDLYDSDRGFSDYYYFNLFLRSGKVETIYCLNPTIHNFNKEGIDALTNIINQYINSL